MKESSVNSSPQRHRGHREEWENSSLLLLGVPPRKASGLRFPLYSSLVPRCGVLLQSLTRILLVLTICLAGCSRSVSFEKSGWQKKVDWDYPNRDAMVQDLLDTHKLMGLTMRAITELLGEADNIDPTGRRNSLSYQIEIDFGWDIDPVYTKYLLLEFNEDSIVTKVELLEWKR